MYQCVNFYIGLAELFGRPESEDFSVADLLVALCTDVIFDRTGLGSIGYNARSSRDFLGQALSANEPSLFLNSTFSTVPVNVSFDLEDESLNTVNISVNPDVQMGVELVHLKASVGSWAVFLSCDESDADTFKSVVDRLKEEWGSHLERYTKALSSEIDLNPTADELLSKSLSNQLQSNRVVTYSDHLANEFNNKNTYIQSLISENARLMDQRSAGNRLIDFAARKLKGFRSKGALMTTTANVEPAAPVEDIMQVKQRHSDRAKRRLNSFLENGSRITLGDPDQAVDISILLITWGRAELTFECLESLSNTMSPNIEVVVVDNDSPDNTLEMLSRFDGNIKVIENENNDGFLLASNIAAKHATAEVILLLNNDTTVPEDAIGNGLKRLRSSNEIGAVGAKIILPNGELQEAGSFVWDNGGASGYLRGAKPDDPHGDFVRPVDFGSGAFLMIRKSDWDEIGGFDEQFVPAYFEEVDFCLSLRGLGKHVVYDPTVILNHFEFASSKKRQDAIDLQKANRGKLEAKHKKFLQAHRHTAGVKNIKPSRTAYLSQREGVDVIQKNVLFIDDLFPEPALGSGFGRACDMVEILSRHVRHLSFLPLNFPDKKPENWRDYWGNRVEVLFGVGRAGFEEYINEWLPYFDHIFVSRPHNIQFILNSLPSDLVSKISSKLIYDAEAIFTFREQLKAEIDGTPWDDQLFDSKLERELCLAEGLSNITVVSEHDGSYFKTRHPEADVHVLMHACENLRTKTRFANREGALFVGNLAEPASPNVDGVKALCKLWMSSDAVKDITLNIVGNLGDSGWHLKYKAANIKFHGRVEDLQSFYENNRIFLAPVRFAAGVPIKVLEAMSYGIPCVISDILGVQLSIENDETAIVRALNEDMMSGVEKLYNDKTLWSSLRNRALKYVVDETSTEKFEETLISILQA